MTHKIAGLKFGRLTAIRRDGVDGKNRPVWLFVCDCGNETRLRATLVVTGHTESCGCLRMERLRQAIGLDLAGKRFGRLLVVSESGRDREGAITWNCTCDCGNDCVVSGKRMVSGNTTSCGCRKQEVGQENIERRRVDYIGKRYGKLVVTDILGCDESGTYRLRCKCDCGGYKVVPNNSLTGGKAISCGCEQKGRKKGKAWMPIGARMYLAARGSIRRARKKKCGGFFTREEVDVLYKKQNGKCVCCNAKLGTNFHRDHIMPLALGGSNTIANIQLLCPTCNGRKGAKDPIVWANEIGRLI